MFRGRTDIIFIIRSSFGSSRSQPGQELGYCDSARGCDYE